MTTMTTKPNVTALLEMGFVKAGSFEAFDIVALATAGALHKYQQQMAAAMTKEAQHVGVIYAYVENGEVVYIGETERTYIARQRNHLMNVYFTDHRRTAAVSKWQEFFASTAGYDIYILPAPVLEYAGLLVSLRQDLETTLVGMFSPRLNTRKKT